MNARGAAWQVYISDACNWIVMLFLTILCSLYIKFMDLKCSDCCHSKVEMLWNASNLLRVHFIETFSFSSDLIHAGICSLIDCLCLYIYLCIQYIDVACRNMFFQLLFSSVERHSEFIFRAISAVYFILWWTRVWMANGNLTKKMHKTNGECWRFVNYHNRKYGISI